MELELTGKVALVPASSRGLGRACALALAREGARVMVSSRTDDAAEKAAAAIRDETGAEVLACAADVTSEEQLEGLVAQTTDRLGPIDVLVTNTGPPAAGRLEELSDDDWVEAFELVTLSVLRLIRLVVPGMRERGWGRVIAIQSTSVRQPIPHLALSNGIRPGVQGILKSLADVAAADGVTVNTVLPGVFLTDRLLGDLKDSDGDVDEQIAAIASRNPSRRVGSPEELGAVVAFLASARASFVNGVALQVDGGSVRSIA
jgi:3-oxoacyl-[acyl-carrier protein] reductase